MIYFLYNNVIFTKVLFKFLELQIFSKKIIIIMFKAHIFKSTFNKCLSSFCKDECVVLSLIYHIDFIEM